MKLSQILVSIVALTLFSTNSYAGCVFGFCDNHIPDLIPAPQSDSGGSCLSVVSINTAVISNDQGNTMHYQISCGGGTATNYSLEDGYMRTHRCSASSSCESAEMTISFDRSYRGGYQPQSYSIGSYDSKKSYVFKETRDERGVDLYID